MSHIRVAWLNNYHLHHVPYGNKKPQWFTELFQGVFLPVWNLHFMGRCCILLLSRHWENAHICIPHEYQEYSVTLAALIRKWFQGSVSGMPTYHIALFPPLPWAAKWCLDQPTPGPPALFFYVRLLDKYYFLYVLWSEKLWKALI